MSLRNLLRASWSEAHSEIAKFNPQTEADLRDAEYLAAKEVFETADQALASIDGRSRPAAESSTYAVINGVLVDIASAEYASWYDAQGW